MHVIHIIVVIVVLCGYHYCSGFLSGRFRIARTGHQLPQLVPAHLEHPALLRPLQANADTWQVPVGQNISVTESSVPAFLKMLKGLTRNATRPSPELLDQLDHMIGRITKPWDVTDLFSSLHKLGFLAGIPKQRTLIIKSVEQLCKTDKMDNFGLTLCLETLMGTGLKYSDLSTDLKSGLVKVIDRTAEVLDARGVTVVFNALVKLGVLWSALPRSTQVVLWKCLDRHAAKLMEKSYRAAVMVNCFAQLEIDMRAISHEQRQFVYKLAMKGISKDTSEQPMHHVCHYVSFRLIACVLGA